MNLEVFEKMDAPELRSYLKAAGLSLECSMKWFTEEPLVDNAWYGVIVARLDT